MVAEQGMADKKIPNLTLRGGFGNFLYFLSLCFFEIPLLDTDSDLIKMLDIPEDAYCQRHKSVPGCKKAEDEAERDWGKTYVVSKLP